MMKTKKLLGVLLALLMLLPVIPLYVSAEIYSGYCGENGDNVKWELDTITKTLTISGEGNMANFATNAYGLRAPWYSYRSYIENVIVEDGIAGISGYSFYGCSNMKNIYISENVTFFGVYSFYNCKNLKSITFPKGTSIIGDYAFKGCSNIEDIYYDGSVREWKNVKIYRSNDVITNANIHYSDVYNIGEETYSFRNYIDTHSKGHCFGMSITSSGYYLGCLDSTNVGASSSDKVSTLSRTEIVESPICYYQEIQGLTVHDAIVAGGTYYKSWLLKRTNISSDWKEVVNYVKKHNYDDCGALQIYFIDENKDSHAINFLRYVNVDGEDRLYAYDNNRPDFEVYFYQDKNGKVKEAVYSALEGDIICISLVDVEKYFSLAGDFDFSTAFYAKESDISIEGTSVHPMAQNTENGVHLMFEVDKDTTNVIITPLIDNATFTYMDKEYSFGKIDGDTYAEFALSTSENETPEFEIINAPEEEPETPSENCSCNCHASGIKKIFFKIINFFQKIFGKNKICACGAKH